jgi:hypothetical protein
MSGLSSTCFGAPDLATRSIARPSCPVVVMRVGNALRSNGTSGPTLTGARLYVLAVIEHASHGSARRRLPDHVRDSRSRRQVPGPVRRHPHRRWHRNTHRPHRGITNTDHCARSPSQSPTPPPSHTCASAATTASAASSTWTVSRRRSHPTWPGRRVRVPEGPAYDSVTLTAHPGIVLVGR